MAQVRLTTIDNPFNPFTQFADWYRFDTVQKGYYTSELLDRLLPYAPEIPPEIADELCENVIDEFLKLNPLGIYKKVVN